MAKTKIPADVAKLAKMDARGKSPAVRKQIKDARDEIQQRLSSKARANPVGAKTTTKGGRTLTPDSCSLRTAEELLASRGRPSAPGRRGTGERGKHAKLTRKIVNEDGTACTYQSAQLAIQQHRQGDREVEGSGKRRGFVLPLGFDQTALIVEK